MRYQFTFLFCGCFAALQGQSLHVHPFVSYGGTALEYTKAMIGNMAYDGIGKRTLLEQYPESWADAATTTTVPVSAGAATDAFGLLLPKQERGALWSRLRLGGQVDVLGNIAGYAQYQFQKYNWAQQHKTHATFRQPRDLNRNGWSDYQAGNRLYTLHSWRYSRRLHRYFLDAGYFHNRLFGGDKNFRFGNSGPLYGFSTNMNHWQASLKGEQNFSRTEASMLYWNVQFSRHHQQRALGVWQYEGLENRLTASVEVARKWGQYQQWTLGLQGWYHQLCESANTFRHTPTDKGLRLTSAYTTPVLGFFLAKMSLSADKRATQSWLLLPTMQLDWALGNEQPLFLSAYFNSGRRMVRPLEYHLDWLATASGFQYRATPFETAWRYGLNLSHGGVGRSALWKVRLDRCHFGHKALLRRAADGQTLEWYSAVEPLRLSSVEGMFNSKVSQLQWHAIYRWEHWGPSGHIPFQAAHAAQARLRYTLSGKGALSAHYTVKSPQDLKSVRLSQMPPQTAVYQRLDLALQLYLNQLLSFKKNYRSLQLNLYCDNAPQLFGRKHRALEYGLLLFPETGEKVWSDPVMGNLRLELVWEL